MNLKRFLPLTACFLLSATQLSAQTPPAETPAAKATCNCNDLDAAQARLGRMDSILKDWPNLARYREANAKLTPSKDESRVVFMGDSITDAWPSRVLANFSPASPTSVAASAVKPLRKCSCAFARTFIALGPKAVVILAGTNDIAGNTGPMSLEEIEANLASMSELARAHGIKVVLASVLPVYDGGHNGEGKEIVMTDRRPPEKILALNDWIKKYSAEKQTRLSRLFFRDGRRKRFLKRELSEDGLHPNKAGYAIMAPLAEKAIQSALKM